MKVDILEYCADSQEAVLEISSGEVSLVVFSHPYIIQDYYQDVLLTAFQVDNIIREDYLKLPQKTNAGYFSYLLTAEVVNTYSQTVRIGEIQIKLDTSIPKDISSGEIISFNVIRLELVHDW